MATSIKTIQADVSCTSSMGIIVAKQYDRASRFLRATILDNNRPVVIPASSTVLLNVRRPDGSANSFTCQVNEDGTVTCPLSYWALELTGIITCDISIITGQDEVLTTTAFKVAVERASNGAGDIMEDEEYGILLELIKAVNGALSAEEVRVENEAARNAAEANRDAAEDARISSETARIEAEKKRQNDTAQAVQACENAITNLQLVTAPLYIVDMDTGKNYHAAIQVRDHKPVLIYDEVAPQQSTGGTI